MLFTDALANDTSDIAIWEERRMASTIFQVTSTTTMVSLSFK